MNGFLQPPPLDDNMLVLQLRAQWSVGRQARGESSWSFVMLKINIPAQKEHVAEMWLSDLHTLWKARRPTSWQFDRILVEDRWPNTTLDLVVDVNEPGLGASADSAPVTWGPIVRWRTDFTGRSGRGRTYWGPVQADDLETGFVNDACIDNIETWAEQMLDTFGNPEAISSEPHFCLISRTHDNAPRVPPAYAIIQYNLPVLYGGVQRRRLQYWYPV